MAEKKRLRVGVLFGGRSSEHEISLRSALTVMSAMDPARYEIVPIGIGRSILPQSNNPIEEEGNNLSIGQVNNTDLWVHIA